MRKKTYKQFKKELLKDKQTKQAYGKCRKIKLK